MNGLQILFVKVVLKHVRLKLDLSQLSFECPQFPSFSQGMYDPCGFNAAP